MKHLGTSIVLYQRDADEESDLKLKLDEKKRSA